MVAIQQAERMFSNLNIRLPAIDAHRMRAAHHAHAINGEIPHHKQQLQLNPIETRKLSVIPIAASDLGVSKQYNA